MHVHGCTGAECTALTSGVLLCDVVDDEPAVSIAAEGCACMLDHVGLLTASVWFCGVYWLVILTSGCMIMYQ